ncbi:MAG: hypothetical protein OXJ64_20485 [Boseongicola sp.]|nr:hypothetical protein [Boseongicola sp.]
MDEDAIEADPDRAVRGDMRVPHSIRFRDAEWERVEECAERRGLTAGEFVRHAALSAAEAGPDACTRLAPLIEATFRAAHIGITKLRGDMLDAGRGQELDELVAGARALQDTLLSRHPVEGEDKH